MDKTAFENAIHENCRIWQAAALKITGNAANADDAVQDAMTDICKKEAEPPAGAELPAWIYSIVMHKAYDLVRRRRLRSFRRQRPPAAKGWRSRRQRSHMKSARS